MKPKKTRKNEVLPPREESPPSEEERSGILSIALRRMVMIEGNVYGLEDPAEPDADVDCASMTESCRAVCCSYVFALTQDEVRKGCYRYNTEKPFYMARDPDGYCPYLDRSTFRCCIHESRPLRCRKYACTKGIAAR